MPPGATEVKPRFSVSAREPATAVEAVTVTLPAAPARRADGARAACVPAVAVTARLSWKAASVTSVLVTARVRAMVPAATRTLPKSRTWLFTAATA